MSPLSARVLRIYILVLFFVLPVGILSTQSNVDRAGEGSAGDNAADPGKNASEHMVVAVSPFENTGPDDSTDYIGFQVREFFSSALGSFEGISVVERGRLEDIIKEQKLQLSGMTDSSTTSEIGELLNASHILTGSFSATGGRLSLNARLVDVETGETVASSIVESKESGSNTPLYRALLFDLVSNLPEYDVTIPVQATLETIDQQARKASENYSKALEALYNNDDKKALDYLQETVGGSGVDFVRYGEMASEYSKVLSRVEGSSFYAEMIEKQLARNKELTAQMEPLSLYRSTLKVLTDRVEDLLIPKNIEVSANIPSQETYKMGDVSVRIPLPDTIELKLREETVEMIEKTFGQQDVAELEASGVSQTHPPEGKLLSRKALDGLFTPRWKGSASYAVEFLDKGGNVLYRLLGEDVDFAELGPRSRSFSARAAGNFRVDEAKDGWQLVEGNAVTVQTRQLRSFASVRVVLRPETLKKDSGFTLYSEAHWQSLATHAYRKKSVKISTSEEDTAPAFKEVMISESFFYTGDEALDPVPLMPRDGSIASFALPYGIVYYADRKTDSVGGSWKTGFDREKIVESETVSGDFTEESVLLFSMPAYTGKQRYFTKPLSFTAVSGSSEKTVTVSPDLGLEWDALQRAGYTFKDVTVFDDKVFFLEPRSDEIRAVHKTSGRVLWRTDVGYSSGNLFLPHCSEDVIITDRYYRKLIAFDPASGKQQWEKDMRGGTFIPLQDSYRLIFQSSDEVYTLNRESGMEGWKSSFDLNRHRADYQRGTAVCCGKIYIVGKTESGPQGLYELDPKTGNLAWKKENVYTCASDGERLYVTSIDRSRGGFFLDAFTPEDMENPVWSLSKEGPSDVLLGSGLLFEINRSSDTIAAVDTDTGEERWNKKIGSRTQAYYRNGYIIFSDGRVFNAVDGKLLWRWFNLEYMGNLWEERQYSVLYEEDGSVYASSGEKFDTRAIPRTIPAKEPVYVGTRGEGGSAEGGDGTSAKAGGRGGGEAGEAGGLLSNLRFSIAGGGVFSLPTGSLWEKMASNNELMNDTPLPVASYGGEGAVEYYFSDSFSFGVGVGLEQRVIEYSYNKGNDLSIGNTEDFTEELLYLTAPVKLKWNSSGADAHSASIGVYTFGIGGSFNYLLGKKLSGTTDSALEGEWIGDLRPFNLAAMGFAGVEFSAGERTRFGVEARLSMHLLDDNHTVSGYDSSLEDKFMNMKLYAYLLF